MIRLHSAAWAAPMVAFLQLDPVTTDSAISIGLMVTIIGAVGWLSRVLTQSQEQLKSINEKLMLLASVPERMAIMEHELGDVMGHVKTLEGDVSNLWAAVRSEDGNLLDNTRRERGPKPR